jgi:hypothetical protein
MFDHGHMQRSSGGVADPAKIAYTGQDTVHVSALRLVAETFVASQDMRHVADYDNGRLWSPPQVAEMVETVVMAFDRWSEIRHTEIAQEYLVSLLIRSRD